MNLLQQRRSLEVIARRVSLVFCNRARFQQVVSSMAHVRDEILHGGRGKSSGRVHHVAAFQFVARRFVTVPFFSQDVLRLSCRENTNNWQQIIFRASQGSEHKSSRNILLFSHCLRQESSVSIRRVVLESFFGESSNKSDSHRFWQFLCAVTKERKIRRGNKIDSVFNDTCWQLKARLGIPRKSII